MKNKFEKLSKREQKDAINEYKNASTHNEEIVSRLNRLKGVGIIGIIYSLIMFTLDLLREHDIFDYGFNTFDNIILSYIIDASLLIICVFFLIKANQLLKTQVNKYLIEKSKPKQKDKKK